MQVSNIFMAKCHTIIQAYSFRPEHLIKFIKILSISGLPRFLTVLLHADTLNRSGIEIEKIWKPFIKLILSSNDTTLNVSKLISKLD